MKCFSLFDVQEGFLHIPLDEESSRMTMMHALFEQYLWWCPTFGISSAMEKFQMRLMAALEGLAGTICVADNILVFVKAKEFIKAEQCHDC